MTAKSTVLIPAYGKPVRWKNDGLDSLQIAVGGWIEGIDIRFAGVDLPAYANEEAKLIGLPRNETATQLWLDQVEANGLMTLPGDYIAGDVVVTGPIDDEGDSTSLSDGLVELLLALPEQFEPEVRVAMREQLVREAEALRRANAEGTL